MRVIKLKLSTLRHSIFKIQSTHWIGLILTCLFFVSTHTTLASNSRLPDGTEFIFWEQPLTFSKTYYVDANSRKSSDKGPGTLKRPFRTISKAAEVLKPGERVVIASGIYRERVSPARGGSGPDKMISYEAAPGATVIVKGSDILKDGWETSPIPVNPFAPQNQPAPTDVFIWKHKLGSELFSDNYNPFALPNLPADWSWLNTKAVDMGPYVRRRGLIFVDGKPLEPVESYRELANPIMQRQGTGLPSRSRLGPIMQEIGGSPDRKFSVDYNGNLINIRLPSNTLDQSTVEITTREQAFAPRESGLGFIRVKGIRFQHSGNGFPPPQLGLVSTSAGHHWIIENNIIEWANGVALDIGGQHWGGPRIPMAGHSHIVRGNTIRYAGVEGIGGMGTQNTLIENNLIEWVGWQNAERAWEAAGAKFHFATNLLFRNNIVRHIRHANGIWLDVRNTNNRITGNLFADIETVSAAIHMEMSLVPNQIDNNIIWDVRNAEPGTPGQRGAGGSGIFLHASDQQIVAQNLIGRCDNVGVFPVYRADRQGSGTGIDHKIHNNIFTRCDKGAIVFIQKQNQADGNLYAKLPKQFQGLFINETQQWLDLNTSRIQGWDKQSAVSDLDINIDPDKLELTISGQASLQSVSIFNQIDNDFFGTNTEASRFPGPFKDLDKITVMNIDPRKVKTNE